ncbi:MAG: 4Fe-4S binding protein [Candidatus Aquicultorales bacterium]
MARIDYGALKQGGIIKQRQMGLFSVRVRILLGNLGVEQVDVLSSLARRYGTGDLHLTVRQCVEIPNIPYEALEEVRASLELEGFKLGACGPRVRVITACQGTNLCPHALGDTASLAVKLDAAYYGKGPLHHKFKMAVTGCPNACIKPQENDLGFVGAVEPSLDEEHCITCNLCESVCPTGAITIDGRGFPVIDKGLCARDGKCIQICPTGALVIEKQGWQVYAGGKFGRRPQLGAVVAEFVGEDEAVAYVDRVLAVYASEGRKGERLGDLINRVGIDAFKGAVEEG